MEADLDRVQLVQGVVLAVDVLQQAVVLLLYLADFCWLEL